MACFTCENLTIDLQSSGTVKRIVDNASFELEKSRIYDLAGASGSGKTTVLLACAAMVPIVSGTFTLEGRTFDSLAPEQWRKHVCLVPQKAEMAPGSIRDNLLLPWSMAIRKGEQPPSAEELKEALASARLEDVELDRDASQLSGGQAARVALIRAFLTKPKVLLLDEVDAALDEESSSAISIMTKAQAETTDAAILRIRHRKSDGLACKTFRIEEGKVL